MTETKLNRNTITFDNKVMPMLTKAQKTTLKKFRDYGTKEFTRNDYQQLSTIKKNCRYILENYQEAYDLYLELTK